MHIFKKSSKLDNVLYDVRGPVVEEAARMEERGTHVLKLNIGNPAPFGFRTPDEVIYDMSQQLSDCEGYSPSQGLFSARKAIMQYSQIKKLPNVTINDIYTGNGVSELINLCMSALLDNGDEILIPSPDYPLWTACATLAGGKAVHYICDEQSDWYPDIEDMRRKITDRTKALVIINPNNPTGALYPKEVLQKIVDLAREHHLIIFSDEIYDRLVMDGKEHISIASLAPDLFCVTFSGLSKSHMIAGFRIGWMVLSGNKAIAKDYIEGKPSHHFEQVQPSYALGYQFIDLNTLFSPEVNQALKEALLAYEKKIPGFVSDGAVLSAVESRSSSSIRILRQQDFQSNIQGIYPSGEGSGYAGGIMTSAIDGIRAAEKLIETFSLPQYNNRLEDQGGMTYGKKL